MDPATRVLNQSVRAGALVLAAAIWLGSCTQGDSSSPVANTPSTPPKDSCEGMTYGRADPPSDFEVTGRDLEGDVDGDGRPDRVALRANGDRPKACRRMLVVETSAGETMTAAVKPLDWPSPDPKLRLLAEIDGRRGLEAVIAVSPAPSVFRSGSVFTALDGELALMRLGGSASGSLPRLFPFYNEFPAGVDCARSPGEIVVTDSVFAPRGDDSVIGITRTYFHSNGATFQPDNHEEFLVDCCNGAAARRWPETADDPFRNCPDRIQ